MDSDWGSCRERRNSHSKRGLSGPEKGRAVYPSGRGGKGDTKWYPRFGACLVSLSFDHPAAKWGRQNGIGKRATKNVKESDEMVTKRRPKQKKVTYPPCYWTTGVPDNGNECRKFRAIPRLYPLRSLVCTFFKRLEAEGLLDYQGRAGIISIVRWNLRPVIFGVDIPFRVPPSAAQ